MDKFIRSKGMVRDRKRDRITNETTLNRDSLSAVWSVLIRLSGDPWGTRMRFISAIRFAYHLATRFIENAWLTSTSRSLGSDTRVLSDAPVLEQETIPSHRFERGNGVLHLATVTPPIIHRVWLRVTNRQSSGNTVGSLRKRGEKTRSSGEGEREREKGWAWTPPTYG